MVFFSFDSEATPIAQSTARQLPLTETRRKYARPQALGATLAFPESRTPCRLVWYEHDDEAQPCWDQPSLGEGPYCN